MPELPVFGTPRPRSVWPAVAVLAAAAVLFVARLDREMVDVWDESLYATTALEMVQSGDWLVTTFQGVPDYYNSKPPLNVWLIAAMFQAFGPGLIALRLVSAIAAWLTVLVVWRWTRDAVGAGAGFLTALVLTTSYPFLFVHAGRTGNPDALLTLAITLTFTTLWTSHDRPGHAIWIGPLTAVGLMLKGPGALAFFVPMALAGAVTHRGGGSTERLWWRRLALGAAIAAVPVVAWAAARWQVDGDALFRQMLGYDLAARATSQLDGHEEPWWFYARLLGRHWYDWLTVVAVAVVAAADGPRRLVDAWRALPASRRALVATWFATTFVLPTVVPTRLAWYLNPFYPGAAVVAALAIAHAWQALRGRGHRERAYALAALVGLAVVVAVARMGYRSHEKLDVNRSPQGLLLAVGAGLDGHRVYMAGCPRPEAFLAAAAGASCVSVPDVAAFRQASAPGDFWIDRAGVTVPDLTLLGVNRRASLHRRP